MKVEVDAVSAGLRVEPCKVANGADAGNGEAKRIELCSFGFVLHVVGQVDEHVSEALQRREGPWRQQPALQADEGSSPERAR